MGFLIDLFSGLMSPPGTTAYVIIKKGGGTLKRVDVRGKNTFNYSWNSITSTLNGSCLYWSTQSEAREYALSHGLDLSEIEIGLRRVI